jgi:hypothetical protein
VKTAIAFALIFALASQALWAGVPDQKHVEKIRKKVSQYLEDGRHVSVETYDDHKLAGIISQAAPDDFVLINAGRPVTLRYSEVKKVKAPMDPQKRSIIVSIAVLGALFGTILAAAVHDQ